MFELPPAMALVKRELLTNLRKVRVFWTLLLIVSILTLICVSMWPRQTGFGISARMMTGVLVSIFGFLTLVAGAVAIPPLAATSVVSEKEQETYDLLSLTLIRPSGIILGKMLNAIGYFFLLIIGCLPIFGAVFFAVGIDWVQLSKAGAIILISAFSCASISVACSSRFRKTYTAIIFSYVAIFLANGGIVLIVVLLFAQLFEVRAIGSLIGDMLSVMCPFVVLGTTLTATKSSFLSGIIYQFLLCAVSWFTAVHALRRTIEPPKVSTEKVIDDPTTLAKRRASFPFYLIDPLRRKKSIEDGRNPMMVRELRWGMMGRASVMIRVFYVAFVAYMFLGMGSMFLWGSFTSVQTWLAIEIIVTIAGAPLLMSNSFTKEYEYGNMDMLRMTLLRPKEIIMGKVYAGSISLSPLILAAFFSLVPFFVWSVIEFLLNSGSNRTATNFSGLMFRQWPILVSAFATLLVCSLLSLAAGFFASILTKKTSSAVALSYIFTIFLYLGSYIALFFLSMLSLLFGSNQFIRGGGGEDTITIVSFFSPVLALFYGWDHYGVLGSERNFYELSQFIFYWGSSMVIFALLGIGMIRASIRILERRMQDQ